MRRLLTALTLTALVAAAAVIVATSGPASAATSATTLRLDGVGPLSLGMTRAAAVKTGWLAHPAAGCKLGGKPYPVVYTFSGKAAPAGLKGTAEFNRGRLTVVTVDHGARTAAGTEPGVTSVTQMVKGYRAAGYSVVASYSDLFDGTFVGVSRKGRRLLTGFAAGQSKVVGTLGLRVIPTCE